MSVDVQLAAEGVKDGLNKQRFSDAGRSAYSSNKFVCDVLQWSCSECRIRNCQALCELVAMLKDPRLPPTIQLIQFHRMALSRTH